MSADDLRVHYQGSRVAMSGISVIVEGPRYLSFQTLDPPYTQEDVDRLTEKLKQQVRACEAAGSVTPTAPP